MQISGAFGFLGVLTMSLITLKLTGYIDWSWVVVLAPLWLPAAVIFVVCTLFIINIYRLVRKKPQ